MPKLSAIKPTLGRLPPALAVPRDQDGHSAVAEPWRAWYSLAEWKRLRIRVFIRDDYTCQMKGCGKVTSWPIADHRIPHRGDRDRFFDEANVQTLCKPCHDGAKQAEERRRPG